jgi:hypothetical protein
MSVLKLPLDCDLLSCGLCAGSSNLTWMCRTTLAASHALEFSSLLLSVAPGDPTSGQIGPAPHALVAMASDIATHVHI